MAFIEYTEKQKQLRKEVDEFLKSAMTQEVADMFDPAGIFNLFAYPALREFNTKLGQKGWLLPWLPKEWGGMNLSNVDTLFLNDTLLGRGAIAPLLLMNTGTSIVGPTLFRIGSEEQKKEFLPRIAKGEIEICIGYTEPEAGTDLASLQMRAVEDGDSYIINGQKRFQTAAHCADYHWIIVRTDPSVAKHRGLTLFLVDMKSPGITVSPMWCIGGEKTNEVFYDNVRVPKTAMVGEVNRGFVYVMMALQFERNFPTGGMRWLFNKLVRFARESKLAKDPLAQNKIADIATELEVATLFSYRMASIFDEGKMPTYEVSMIKIFTTEMYHRMLNMGIWLMDSLGMVADDSEWGRLAVRLQDLYQRSLPAHIGGGTNDMLRSYMVTRGFGVPSSW